MISLLGYFFPMSLRDRLNNAVSSLRMMAEELERVSVEAEAAAFELEKRAQELRSVERDADKVAANIRNLLE